MEVQYYHGRIYQASSRAANPRITIPTSDIKLSFRI